jgi:hypothetical protein
MRARQVGRGFKHAGVRPARHSGLSARYNRRAGHRAR